ncbi:capsid protein [Bosea sp. Leaf344]|uniref:phage major capsid protein n=1 Tax=Bosea sp. Leaf344 TaxID=1736346 RepID=UPI0006FC4F6F|nr:phage major capsid protein [Bosea sp. Leaf344]KQU54443.1 capsid protein [Bosea sp. Leaf344]
MSERLEIKASISVDDAGTITGTAWPFGTPDRVNDVIEKGAFGAPARLPMLWAHDQAQAIGVWDSVTETDAGLTVKGRLLIDDVARAREVRALVREGAVSGLSIGFVSQKATARARGGRTISKLDLHEISIVAVPCHPGATITSMKAAIDGPATAQEQNVNQEEKTETKDAPAFDQKAFDALQARLDKLEAKGNRLPAANDNLRADNDNHQTKAFADFVRSGDASEVKSLGYSSPSTGGILAPEKVATSILEKVAEFSPVRSLAQTISMAGPLLQLPRLVDEVAVGEVAETATRPSSEPSFDQIDLKAFEMAVTVPVTRILLEDAQIDLASYLGNHIARRFGQKEAAWFVNGNGTTQAEGVLTSGDVAEVEADITGDDLIDLFYSIKTAYSSNGAWLMNRKTMAVVRKLKDADGAYIWERSIAAGQPPLILGRPVYEAVDMPDPAAGNTAIVFGDFATGYAIADRVGFDIFRDEYTGADNGIIKLRARRRVGGRIVMGEALTKLKVA